MGSITTSSAPSARYRVSARVAAPGLAIGSVNASEIEFDVGRRAGEGLPGPAEFLALSLGACILKNLERFSHLLSFTYDGAEVTVEAERQDDPPRFTTFTYELRIRTDESQHRVELLHRNLRRFGTVFNTLAASCAVGGTIVANRSSVPAFDRPVVDRVGGQRCCEPARPVRPDR